ncbi:uncharacterized protein LOC144577609 isoform X1 [Callithrix jacchus]
MRITRWVERVDSGVCLEKQVFLEPRSNSGLAGCARSWAAKKRRRKNMCPNENEGRVEVLQDCVLEDIKEEEPLADTVHEDHHRPVEVLQDCVLEDIEERSPWSGLWAGITTHQGE